MKRNFYRVLHVVLAVLIGLDILNINRTLSIIGSIALIINLFVMTETHSDLTIRYKIMQEFIILAAITGIGSLIFGDALSRMAALIFLVALFFEWKFRVFSSRWEI